MLNLYKKCLLWKCNFGWQCVFIFALMLQVSSSLLSSSGEGTGSGSAVKYPGQDGLYTSVGLSQSSDVASVRGEPWCPMALAWASESFGGQQSLAPLSGCYEVWKYSGAMFVSFLAADARRVGQGGEKGWGGLQSHCELEARAWNSWDWFPDWCGGSYCIKKTKGISRPDDQSGGLLWRVSAVHSISLPSHGTEPDLARQSKAIVYITDFLCEEKAVDWIPRLRKVLYSRRTFRFLFLSTTGIMPHVPRQLLWIKKKKKYL